MLFQLSCCYAKLNPREVGLCYSFTASITKSQPANKEIYLEKFIRHTNDTGEIRGPEHRIPGAFAMKPATASCQKQSARHRQSACSNSANVAPTWPMLQRYVDLLSVSHMFLSLPLPLPLSLACSIDSQPNLSRPKTLHTNLFFLQELYGLFWPLSPPPKIAGSIAPLFLCFKQICPNLEPYLSLTEKSAA